MNSSAADEREERSEAEPQSIRNPRKRSDETDRRTDGDSEVSVDQQKHGMDRGGNLALEPGSKISKPSGNGLRGLPSPGIHWDDLRPISKLRKGQFGRVVSVLDKNTKFPYALKCVRVDDSRALRRAKKEALVMQALAGVPAVVRIVRVFHSKRQVYILMELCRHGDMFEWIRKHGPMSEYTAQDVALQLCQALKAMHKRGIVHRDIKPENILIEERASVRMKHPSKANVLVPTDFLAVRLADFGLASLTQPPTDGTAAPHEFAGTLPYMPPEAGSTSPSPPVDMWSLGVTLFVCLGGYHPFDEFAVRSPSQIQERITKVNYSFGDRVWDRVSAEAKDFISSLLVADPRKRNTAAKCMLHKWIQEALA